MQIVTEAKLFGIQLEADGEWIRYHHLFHIAFWRIVGGEKEETLLMRKSAFRAKAPETDTMPGMVEVQNKMLAEFSREIAAAIQSLE